MMTSKTWLIGVFLSAIVAVVGCGGDDNKRGGGEALDGGADGTVDFGPPPARIDTHPPCVFSADCPDGQHCDLGECIQDCNVDNACADGLSCSARARCLGATDTDTDPPPVTERVGTVSVEQESVLLSDRDTTLTIHLMADTTEPVRYRVQLNAPHLSIDEPRGEFTGETLLTLNVNTVGLEGQDVPGNVRIFTTLGTVVVDTPIHVGLTGTYQGALTYDSTAVPLGSSQIVVDVFESNGDVKVRFDPDSSLLFPRIPAATDGQVVFGQGAFTVSDGFQFVARELIPATYGGADNLFQRDIGREIVFHLQPSDRGTLQGTFTETFYGLFVQPVALTGTVYLERQTVDKPVDFFTPPAVTMPSVDPTVPPSIPETFANWTDAACNDALVPVACPSGQTTNCCSSGSTSTAALECARAFDSHYHGPMEAWLAGDLSSYAEPMGELVNKCLVSLGATAPLDTVPCAQIVPLACATKAFVDPNTVIEVNTQAAQDVFATLVAHILDPGLLVSQQYIVDALKDSFVFGFDREAEGMLNARSVLRAPSAWVLNPMMLEHFRRIPAPTTPPTTEPPNYLAARTLGRLFYVLSTIDGEIARSAASDRLTSLEDRVMASQQRGLMTLLEAATLLGLIDSWAQAPAELGTEFTDVLTPMDRGFRALSQGAIIFGVPEGLVPLVWEPGRELTSFEQMLSNIQTRLDKQKLDEQTFHDATREFEQNADKLAAELQSVNDRYDAEISSICGPTFVIDGPDWSTCGANDEGDLGAALVGIRLADERLRASENRIKGMAERIAIEQNRINDVQAVRDGTIRFIDQNGDSLVALSWAETTLDATLKMIEIGAQANVWNGGAPLGEAAVAFGLQMEKGAIDAERINLQTAQEIRIQADNAEVEVINGMSTIKNLMVDMAQLQLEMRQDVLQQLQAAIDARNLLNRAKALGTERAKVKARLEKSPFLDPSFRVLQTQAALQALRSRAAAQQGLYLAGRALEYYLNFEFDEALPKAVLNVFNSTHAENLKLCLSGIFDQSALALGAAQDYSTEFSVRERLGIVGPRVDEVTGEELSEGEQFRRFLLRNENIDGAGGVGIEFSSNLDPGNGLWSSNVCDDRINTVEAQIVGDFLGDNQAAIRLDLLGGGVIRRCDRDELVNWSTEAENVTVQAGVNTYGTASPNTLLFGLSVASAKWRVAIPGPLDEPNNDDIDLTKVEDIILRIKHKARPIRDTPLQLDISCFADVGAGAGAG